MNLKPLRLLTLCLLLLSPPLLAQRAQEASDAVLDRLERKLIEQEASTLKIEAPPVKRQGRGETAITLPATPSSVIMGKLPEQKDFAALDQQLRGIEQDIDELSGQVEKLKSDFQTKAGKGSLVEIVLQLEAPEDTSLRDLSFGINEHTIFNKAGSGSWNPGAQVLLYSGPLEPGEHKIKLQARTVRRYGEGLPLDQNLYHLYEQSFPIVLPQGSFRKGFRLKLARPEQQNIHAKAVLENYDIP